MATSESSVRAKAWIAVILPALLLLSAANAAAAPERPPPSAALHSLAPHRFALASSGTTVTVHLTALQRGQSPAAFQPLFGRTFAPLLNDLPKDVLWEYSQSSWAREPATLATIKALQPRRPIPAALPDPASLSPCLVEPLARDGDWFWYLFRIGDVIHAYLIPNRRIEDLPAGCVLRDYWARSAESP